MTALSPAERTQSPIVIGIAGSVAAGKTTLLQRLAEIVGAAALIFDDYDRFGEWPQDLAHWLAEGANPSLIRIPRLQEDLETLLDERAIRHPRTDETVEPSAVILIEEPFGRERPELAPLIDRLIYVDVPADISVLRLVHRSLGLSSVPEEGLLSLSKQDLAERIERASSWLSRYTLFRSGYAAIRERILLNADLILDGMLSIQDLAGQAARWIDSL